ncbi:GtrA family protein [Pedococcus sp. 2YAF34]|uniref:GtrA family protein n=1 Tax=Pedococcus sp. 2YAF34 TaxID=3233032 RepID=UPI003F9E4981
MAATPLLIGAAPPRAPLRRLDPTVVRFACVGVGSTVVHLGLFAALLHLLPTSQTANLGALLAATIANTAANRRFTFGVTSTTAAVRQHLQSLGLFALTWGLSAGALWLLHAWATQPPALVQTVVVGGSMVGSTVVRYVAMRTWIFAAR